MATPENGAGGLADPASKLILIVDDDAALIELLKAGLSGQGFLVETAIDGEEALLKFRKRAPDLVITDLMMPVSGGYELVRELQKADSSPIPVIVATARQIDESTETMIRSEANVVGFLQKPIKLAPLYARLHELLRTQPKPRR